MVSIHPAFGGCQAGLMEKGRKLRFCKGLTVHKWDKNIRMTRNYPFVPIV